MTESQEYEIRLRDLFSGKLDRIEQRLNQFENKVNNTGNIAAGVFGGIALERGLSKMVDLFEQASSHVVELGMNMEKTRISFTTLLQGGSEFADRMIGKFQKFAQETPFSTNDVLQGARRLTAYRYAAEEIIPVMKQLGDITSGLNLNFQDVVWLVGHTKSLGYMDRRILREFTLRGIGIDEAIEKTKGISHQEFESQIRQRQITYKDIAKALNAMTSEGGQFYNLNEKLSKSVAGRWERFKDTLEIIATRMGEQLLPMLSGWLDKAFNAINKFQDVDMSGVIGTFNAIERAAEKLFELMASPEWSQFGNNIGYGIRRTLAEFERLINRFQYMADVAHEINQYGLVEGSRHNTLRQQQLNKEFQDSFADFERREQEIAKGRRNNVESAAQRRLYAINDLYDGSRPNFKYIDARKRNGLPGEDDGYSQGGIEKISAGSRNITVNITKLIETVNFTKSYEESEARLKEMITRALVAEVNNVNIVAN